MNVPEINRVKETLEDLQSQGQIAAWELPYENLLTRLSAAIFFVTPAGNATELWKTLEKEENFSYRENTEKKLSDLAYRLTFSAEEKEKNEAPQSVNQ